MKTKLLILLALLAATGTLWAQNEFITLWKPSNPSSVIEGIATPSTAQQIYLPLAWSKTRIDWEEVGYPEHNGTFMTSNITVFPKPTALLIDFGAPSNPDAANATYLVKVKIDKETRFNNPYIRFGNALPDPVRQNYGDQLKILEVRQWGDSPWWVMDKAFANCENLQVTATDVPNLSKVGSLAEMFVGCTALTGNNSFALWNTSNVFSMSRMFEGAAAFNAPVGSWDLAKATTISAMFQGAAAFNQPLENWNTAAVTSMYGVFFGASSFNQPIYKWNTQNVTNVSKMFKDAAVFNQDISTWDLRKVTKATDMLSGSAISCRYYNTLLMRWATADRVPNNLNIGSAAPLKYSTTEAQTHRNTLVTAKGWTITGDAFDAACAVAANTPPVANAGENRSIQEYSVITLNGKASTDADGDALTYLWTPPAGITLNDPTSPTPSFQSPIITADTDYTFTLTVNDGNGGENSAQVTIRLLNVEEADAFITIWKPSNPKIKISGISDLEFGTMYPINGHNPTYSDNNSIYYPGGGTNYTILWEEVGYPAHNGILMSVSSSFSAPLFINFGAPLNPIPENATYRVKAISGSGFFNEFHLVRPFSDAANGDAFKLIEVSSWGKIPWISMQRAFQGCNNLDVTATDTPELSRVTNMSGMFRNCGKLVGNNTFSTWNTGNVTDMNQMFSKCTLFNQPIGSWNTENVTLMYNMFYGAEVFNQNIGNWNTGKVTDMSQMFYGAKVFNQSLNNWNTAAVTDMTQMFYEAAAFNGNISSWNTGNVTDMTEMFRGAVVFNQPIGGWDVGKLTNMSGMFIDAAEFNQPIGNWNTANVEDMRGVFVSCLKFNQPLENWNTSKVYMFKFMFYHAEAFNQPLEKWDVSKGTEFTFMFGYANAFNQPLEKWNVSSANMFPSMFEGAKAFNQPLNKWRFGNFPIILGTMFAFTENFNQPLDQWNTSNFRYTNYMFYNAKKFDQDLGMWNLGNLNDVNQNAENMLTNCGMSCKNYNATLIGWAANPATPNTINLADVSPLVYSTAEAVAARAALIAKGWTITGDTYDATCSTGPPAGTPYVTIKGVPDVDVEIYITEKEGSIYWIETTDGTFTKYTAGQFTEFITVRTNAAGTIKVHNTTMLGCQNNAEKVTGIDISTNPKITGLWCKGNQISTLNTSGCPLLEYLSCYYNKLTTMDVSTNTALSKLECDGNQLTAINLTGLTNLININCSNNQMDACALNALYTDLPEKSGGLLRNAGNPGTATSTTSIATAKGWSVFASGDGTGCPPTALENVSKNTRTLTLTPNPARDYFTVQGLETETQITLFDLTGKKVLEKNVRPDEKISVSALQKGIYTLKAGTKTAKLIIH